MKQVRERGVLEADSESENRCKVKMKVLNTVRILKVKARKTCQKHQAARVSRTPMCGRFAIGASAEDIGFRFDVEPPDDAPEPRWNVAPTDSVSIILDEGAGLRMARGKWGFPFSKHSGVAINARVETAAEKWMFKTAAHWHRCIVPATGWYEWTSAPDGKDPHHIAGESPITPLAGLYQRTEDDLRFTILTRNAIESLSGIHQRMPVVILDEHIVRWLNPNDSTAIEDSEIIESSTNAQFTHHRVGREVNKVTNQGPHLARPIQTL